ncbi:MAG: hypothetical protein SGI77_25620 [Pirellulaceae bacterium]|nr:hypothetical protein [Pirellulaceae bacterium]
MSNCLRLPTLFLFSNLVFIASTAVAQDANPSAVTTPVDSPESSNDSPKPDEKNAGQDDLNAAIELKMDANDIDKCTKVIDLIEKAIAKGLLKSDLPLANQLLGSAAMDRAKMQLQEMIKARVSDTMARRVQRKVLSDLELATKSDPTLGEAYLLIAKLSARSDSIKAKEALDNAINNLGHDAEKRGDAYAMRSLFQEDDEAKLADLRNAMKELPQSVEVQRTLFALLIDKDRFEDVYEVGMELLKSNAKNPLAIQATITALLELDRKDEAIKVLDQRVEDDESDIASRAIRANVYLTLDKYEEAIADATKIIELKSDEVEGYFVRCKAYLQRSELDRGNPNSDDLTNARRDIESALDLKPNSVEGIRLRALVSSQQKRYDEAIQDMTLLAKNSPKEPVWLLQLATLYQLNDQPTLAAKVADSLIAMDKKNWQAYRIRGDAKLSTGDQSGASIDYKKALDNLKEGDSDRSALLNNLAWILATSPDDSLRDGKRSIALGTEACELTEYKRAHILSTLAAGYAEAGDFDQAIHWSSKAVELGGQEDHEQLEQLEKELKSYQDKQPWREKQEVKENKPPLIKPEDTIET